jgi:hypothetical protein
VSIHAELLQDVFLASFSLASFSGLKLDEPEDTHAAQSSRLSVLTVSGSFPGR